MGGHRYRSGPAAEDDKQDVLCLGDELMELAYEVLEDEPYTPALPRALQCTEMERDIDQMYARVWRKL